MPEDIRICFVGDSFVNGTGDESALGWTGRLCAAHWQRLPVTCYNLGVRRDTSEDIRARWQAECALRLPDGVDGRIVLSCGVNDCIEEEGRLRVDPERSRANVRAIVEHAARRHKLLMVGPPPVGDVGIDQRVMALSAAFAEDTARLGVPFIELFAPLQADAAYLLEVASNDGAHPRSSGYARIADIISASPHWWR